MKMNNVSDAQILIIDAGAQYGKVSWVEIVYLICCIIYKKFYI